jgi:hypothetical protein
MIKLTTLLKEIQGKIIDQLITKVDPIVKDMVQKAKEKALEKDEKFTKLDEEYYYWMLLMDMVRSFETYTLPTDTLRSFEVNGSVKGSLIINATIERDGVSYPLTTEVIYAGGSNIQRLHYRYLTKTKLPKQPSTPEADAIKMKLKGMTKVQKYQEEIKQYEDRIKKSEEKMAFYNAFKNEDEMIQWIVDNSPSPGTGFSNSYSSPEEFKKMWGDEWQDGFQRRFVKWPTEDIKTSKAAIAKLQAKIDKEQL